MDGSERGSGLSVRTPWLRTWRGGRTDSHDGCAPVRALSATLLGQSKDLAARAELEDGLDDKSPMVRAAVARALGGFSDRTSISKIQPLLDDKSEAVRYMAAAAIVRVEKSKPGVR